MNALEKHIVEIMAGEQTPAPHGGAMKDVLQSMRDTLRDQNAQRALGLFVLAQISGQIKSSVHTAKAMQRARFSGAGDADE